MTESALTGVLARHVQAVNAFDLDGFLATFADDALVNDAHREFWGIKAIAAWAAREVVGDRATMQVTEVIEHHGVTRIRAIFDGDYDKTGLPDPLIMMLYYAVRGDKIDSMFVIRNAPVEG
jgi:hypothetical protein